MADALPATPAASAANAQGRCLAFEGTLGRLRRFLMPALAALGRINSDDPHGVKLAAEARLEGIPIDRFFDGHGTDKADGQGGEGGTWRHQRVLVQKRRI